MNPRLATDAAAAPALCRASLFALALWAVAATAASASAQTSLCRPAEQTLWSCDAGKKTYSVCTSPDLDASAGTMQYRAAQGSTVELRYPEEPAHPKGHFVFSLLRNGASLVFENGGYRYEILELLKGPARIDVGKAGKVLAEIECDLASDTLTLTTTIDRMKAIGISDR
jgi:hypothetical protein